MQVPRRCATIGFFWLWVMILLYLHGGVAFRNGGMQRVEMGGSTPLRRWVQRSSVCTATVAPYRKYSGASSSVSASIFNFFGAAQQPIQSTFSMKYLQRFGRHLVHTTSDNVLLGAGALIAAEMLNRTVTRYEYELPYGLAKSVRGAVSTLDAKMDRWMHTDGDVKAIVDEELHNFHQFQNEFIDKYFTKDLLKRIDRDIQPMLAAVLRDSQLANKWASLLKDFVLVTSLRTSKLSVAQLALQGIQKSVVCTSAVVECTVKACSRIDQVVDVAARAMRKWLFSEHQHQHQPAYAMRALPS